MGFTINLQLRIKEKGAENTSNLLWWGKTSASLCEVRTEAGLHQEGSGEGKADLRSLSENSLTRGEGSGLPPAHELWMGFSVPRSRTRPRSLLGRQTQGLLSRLAPGQACPAPGR